MKRIKLLIITSAIIFVVLITNIIYKEEPTNNNYQPKTTKTYNNALSIMLETGSNTNEYETSTSTSWPTEGYEFNKELSRCENGGELSFDEENKKLQLISDKPEKCYAYFDKYLEFYLDDVLFTAKPSMTWEEWLDSSYSDEWSYKSQIKSYEWFTSNGYYNSSGYFPLGKGKTFVDKYYVILDNKLRQASLLTLSSSNSTNINNSLHSGYCDSNDIGDNKISFSIIITQNDKISKNLTDADILLPPYTEFLEQKKDGIYYVYPCGTTCLSPETLIDVEEIDEKGKKRRRRKKLKDIKVGDKVICINPFTLELDTDTVVECDGQMNKKHTCFDNWYFSDGTMITTIYRHRFYNVEKNKFMYMEEWNIGEHGLNINNEKIKLIKHEHIEEEINHCTLFTEKYNNYFANGLLSGNRRSKEIKL